MSVAPARPASTVVLIRAATRGIEVFLVRRHDSVAFMGGAHVFPGGRVEESDASDALADLSDGAEFGLPRLADVDAPMARAFQVAAARELFEEAGILLARDHTGTMLSDNHRALLDRHQPDAVAGTRDLAALLREQGWRLALDALVYFAHWVTPEIETRRFDTRFFLASAPRAQVARHDTGETADGIWIAPADATARCLRAEIALPPPTWTTLRWLEAFNDVATAMEWARRKPVPRVQPGFISEGETRIVTLPGDATMPDVPGFTARETRFVLSAGHWRPV